MCQLLYRLVLPVLLITGFATCSQAQQLDTIPKKDLDPVLQNYTVFFKDTLGKRMTVVSKPPDFRGGLPAWAAYLQKNLDIKLGEKYIKVQKPDTLGKQSIVVNFLVNPLGLVSEVTADPNKNNHPKLVAEAIRVVAMSPRWLPAEYQLFEDQPGKPALAQIIAQAPKGFTKVNFHHKQSITFAISVIYDKK